MPKISVKRDYYQGEVGTSPFVYAGCLCNNNCIFCFEKDQKFFNKETASLKKEIKIIREKYDFINIMGQEPTLRKDLPELVSWAKENGFKQIGITTNGRMLAYGNLAVKLVENGLNQFVITVAGHNAKLHDWHTQSQGSFNQTVRGIKNVLALPNKAVSVVINLMVTAKNYKQLLAMADFYIKLGAKEINIGHILPFNEEIKSSKKIVAKMSAVAPFLVAIAKKYGQSARFLFVEYPPCVFPKKYRHLSFPCLEESPQKVRIALCRRCPHTRQCVGIHPYYLNLYGAKEFKL
ncbi:MAG TPA: radical SAM protein [Candidatus Portnoybacteria bacterium]|nr:radical SAM protein [Candidatus Portnoybacteria bacterium]